MMGMARNMNLICKMRIKVSSENLKIECHLKKKCVSDDNFKPFL